MIYLDKDTIGAKYLKLEKSVSFAELCSFVVELPLSEHWCLEVKIAKQNKIENLLDYETFEEKQYEDQDMIRSRWVIMQKEKQD